MLVSRSIKSIKLALAAVLLCGAFVVLAPSVAHARNYTFSGGDRFSAVNIYGVKKGKVTYSKKTHTLTLKNTSITATGGYTPIYCSLPKLKIKLVGTNKIKSGDFSAIMCAGGCDLTILGKGKLNITVRKSEAGIDVYATSAGKRGNFYLKSGTVSISKGNPGIRCQSAKIYSGTLKLSNCATGIQCEEWNGSKNSTVRHKGGSFSMSGGKLAVGKVKDFGAIATTISIGKKAKVSVTGAGDGATGLYAKIGEHAYAGKTYSWGGSVAVNGTVTARSTFNSVCAQRAITNKGTIDGTGSYGAAVACEKLVNYGTIKGSGCGSGACAVSGSITGTGTIVE